MQLLTWSKCKVAGGHVRGGVLAVGVTEVHSLGLWISRNSVLDGRPDQS